MNLGSRGLSPGFFDGLQEPVHAGLDDMEVVAPVIDELTIDGEDGNARFFEHLAFDDGAAMEMPAALGVVGDDAVGVLGDLIDGDIGS